MSIRNVTQKTLLGVVPLVALIIFAPKRSAVAQFDPISALFSTVTGMGGLMSTMNSTMGSMQFMENTLVHPIEDISNIQNNGSSMINSYRGWMGTVFHINIASAQTPMAQSLDSMWLNGNYSSSPNPQIYTQFTGVYGQIPSANASPLPTRQTVDMSDATAQDAIQLSVLADADATTSIQQGNTLESQAMATSAGSAPQIEATALAYELSDLAIEHRLYAAQLRLIAARLGVSSAPAKEGATANPAGAAAIMNTNPAQ